MIRRFLLRWVVNGLGLAAASWVLSGVTYNHKATTLIVAALIFSITNALIRPLVVVLALPAIVLTLGLFTLVVNGFMLYLTTLIYPAFRVASFWQAVAAVMIVWTVNYVITQLMEKPA